MPRIDQKTCLKSIITAGLIPLVIEPISSAALPDQLTTNLAQLEELIEDKGADSILAVMSTSSCFAPRACDNVEMISKLCKEKNVAHVVNNAYGVQCRYYAHRLQEAERIGRIDALISSTDKNFMVPVGGSFIYSPKKSSALIEKISKNYPGRASMSPILDLFITLLQMGRKTLLELVGAQKENFKKLKEAVIQTVDKINSKLE